MNTRSLFGLAIVAAGAAAMALYVVQSRAPSTGSIGQGQRFFPDLMTRLNDVASVTIATKDLRVTIEETDGTWTVAEKSGYPANFERVKTLLVGIAELKAIEPKTSNPELFRDIALEDIDAQDATSTLVALKDRGGQPLVDLLVGRTRLGRGADASDAMFVRSRGDRQSWLVEGRVSLLSEPGRWVVDRVIDLRRDRLASATLPLADGTMLAIRRKTPGAPDFSIVGLEAGKEIGDQMALNAIAGLLDPFDLDDVLRASTFNFDTNPATRRAEFRTYDGLVVTLSTLEHDQRIWGRFEAAFEAPPPNPSAGPNAGEPTPPDRESAGLRSATEILAEAAEINARTRGWAYRLPEHRSDVFGRTLDDFTGTPEPVGPK